MIKRAKNISIFKVKNAGSILIVITAIILLFYSDSFAQREGDRILAIVGNDIILESDLQYQVQLYARQNQITQVTPPIIQQLFQQMMIEKIIYAKAQQDSVRVSEEELNRELESRLKSLIEQAGSEERIEEIYGMPLVKIRLTLKDDLEKKLMTDKMKRKKFYAPVKTTDKEVRDFYNKYRDSLPEANEEYELYHIIINRKLTDAERQLAKEKAKLILDSIKSGVDFSELAKRNSDDKASAVNGGDLGFAKKGMFVKEFEEVLFTLNIGEYSEPVETEYGFHIIKLNEKKGEQYRGQHILVAYPMLESADLETISFLNSIRDSINKGLLTFEKAALEYSQDKETSLKGGYIGFVAIDRFDSLYVKELKNLRIGEISKPIRTGGEKNYGFELLKIKSINPPHKLTLETDYNRIKKFAGIFKENKLYEDWIEELKKYVFVDIKF